MLLASPTVWTKTVLEPTTELVKFIVKKHFVMGENATNALQESVLVPVEIAGKKGVGQAAIVMGVIALLVWTHLMVALAPAAKTKLQNRRNHTPQRT